jgi:hypothetical protein
MRSEAEQPHGGTARSNQSSAASGQPLPPTNAAATLALTGNSYYHYSLAFRKGGGEGKNESGSVQ